jgi:integrase/recombinase XerC
VKKGEPRVYRRKYRDRAGVLRETDAWYCDFTVPGQRPVKGEPLRVTDEAAARKRARELFAEAQRKAVGLTDPLALHAARPIEEHLAEFEVSLRANNVSDSHRRERMRFLVDFVGWAHVKRLADIDTTHGPAWVVYLQGQLAAPAIGKRDDPQPLSARSLNKRRATLRQFGKWLVDHRRLAFNPFLTIRRLNEEADRRYLRGALTEEQLVALFREAPYERGVAYVFMATTGLRRGETAALTWAQLDLEAGRVTVTAKRAKNRKRATKALHPFAQQLLKDLREHRAAGEDTRRQGNFAGKPRAGAAPTDRVFNSVPAVRTLRRDLEAAGCPTSMPTPDGEAVVDVHALRHTLGTLLGTRGVAPRLAQAIMRHSDPSLTAKVYQHVGLEQERDALATLLPGIDRADQQSTDGDDDPTPGGGAPRSRALARFISRRSPVRVRPSLSTQDPAGAATCARGVSSSPTNGDTRATPGIPVAARPCTVSRAVSRRRAQRRLAALLGPRFRRRWAELEADRA